MLVRAANFGFDANKEQHLQVNKIQFGRRRSSYTCLGVLSVAQAAQRFIELNGRALLPK